MKDGAFDQMAAEYDDVFTNSRIGQLQRAKVWEYLNSQFEFGSDFRVLELNCGTGEDACMFAKKGCRVTATDISFGMLNRAKEKAQNYRVENLVNFERLDMQEMSVFQTEHKYDLVFSNFGGLNCIGEKNLRELAEKLTCILKTEGRFVAVIMPAKCMMETLYFLSKFQCQQAFRRGQRIIQWKNDQGEVTDIHYYPPKEFGGYFKESFTLKEVAPIGIFIPPSYTEAFFKRYQRILDALVKLDGSFAHPIFSGISDHYLIDLKIKDRACR